MDYLFGLDAGFLMPTGVALASLHRHLRQEDRVTVLHTGLSDVQLDALRSCTPGTPFTEVDCADLIDRSWPVPAYITSAAYCRNLAADLMPDVQRCLYIDGDTIVRRDPRPLATIDLGGATVAAVRSRVAPFLASPGGVFGWFELGLPGSAPHFNSGVLVLDLVRWRERDINAEVASYLRRFGDRSTIPDQEALNVALFDDWLPVGREWNYVTHIVHSFLPAPETEPIDPAIVHFAGQDKPWAHGPKPMFAEEWYELLASTPWRSYTPQPPQTPRGVRAASKRLLGRGLRRLRAAVQEQQ